MTKTNGMKSTTLYTERKIELKNYLEKTVRNDFPERNTVLELIDTITTSTLPIRKFLEDAFTEEDFYNVYGLPQTETENVYGDSVVSADRFTHSFILETVLQSDIEFAYAGSEESKPIRGNGEIGIFIDPVDGSSNVAVNRTVGTICSLNYHGYVLAAFYVLYGIINTLTVAIDGQVHAFSLQSDPRSMYRGNYLYQGTYVPYKERQEPKFRAKCMGGNETSFPPVFQEYSQTLIEHHYKHRYSGSLVGDVHLLLTYPGVYLYPTPAKIRNQFEWLPLAFVMKTLGGELLLFPDEDQEKPVDMIPFSEVEVATKENVFDIYDNRSRGILGDPHSIKLFKEINGE